MDSGGMPADWKPEPPPPIGSAAWKNDMAFQQVHGGGGMPSRNAIFKLQRCHGYELGYMVIDYRPGAGWNYFRVDEIEGVFERKKD